MIRARYSDFQQQLSRVAGTTGMSPADARVMDYTNAAIFELMNEGDWPSLVARIQFRVTRSRIVLPSDFDRILYLTINRAPVQMQSPWFEFVGDGPDSIDSPYGVPPADPGGGITNRFVGVLDREQIFTFEDIPSDGNVYYPVIYGTADERTPGNPARPVAVVLGYDNNGRWIRTQAAGGKWIDGMELPINGDAAPYATQGVIPMSLVSGFVKPETHGYVELYVTCPATGANVFLCNYAPNETNPFYRCYVVPGLNAGTTYCVIARCRRRYRPITDPADFLLISNLPALTTMLQAIYYREAKDFGNYQAYKAEAVAILQKEAKAYIGLQRQKPLITFGEGLGVRRDGLYVL